jgi:tetratricopeptide (TPR) repeat protein
MVLFAYRFHAEAKLCLSQAERLDAREPRWPYYQGRVLAEEDLEAALPKLQRAVEVCGNVPDAPRLFLADVLLVQGRLGEAEGHYRAVLLGDPSNARAHLGLGRLAYTRHHIPEALSQLRSFCGEDPRTRRASGILLAEIYRHQGETADADRELQRVAGLPRDSAWPDPYFEEVRQLATGRKANCDRARQLFNEGRVREATDLLRQTVRDYPHSDVAWLMLGQVLLAQQDWEAAEKALRAAVREAPDSDENLVHLGLALAGRDDDQAAVECFRQATKLRPENAWAHLLLGQCLTHRNDPAGALEAFRAAVRYQPQSDEAHLLLAEALSRQGENAAALVHLGHALRLNPSNPRAKHLQQQLQQ